MDKRYLIGFILTLLLIFIAKQITEKKSVIVGDPAVDFQYTTLEGKESNLFPLTAQYTLLHFWGSWCQPCRAGNSTLTALYQNAQPKDLKIISIGIEKASEPWRAAIAEDDLNWPDQFSSFSMFDGRIPKKYKVTSTPMYFLINRDKKIIMKTQELTEITTVLDKNQIKH